MGRVFADTVLKANPDITRFELIYIAAKMHKMNLRPSLVECLRALENNEVDPKDIIEEMISPSKPEIEEQEESKIRGSQNIVDEKK